MASLKLEKKVCEIFSQKKLFYISAGLMLLQLLSLDECQSLFCEIGS